MPFFPREPHDPWRPAFADLTRSVLIFLCASPVTLRSVSRAIAIGRRFLG
jgi:hypothetical protein